MSRSVCLQVPDQLFRGEMVVLGEDMMHQVALLTRKALGPGPAGEIFPELVFRRLRHLNGG